MVDHPLFGRKTGSLPVRAAACPDPERPCVAFTESGDAACADCRDLAVESALASCTDGILPVVYGPTSAIEPGEVLYALEATDYPADMPDGSIEHLMEILGLIADHRYFQDIQWGGPDHDDHHKPDHWELILRGQVYRLTQANGGDPEDDYPDRLLKVAAIAVAARQSWDRLKARAAMAEELNEARAASDEEG